MTPTSSLSEPILTCQICGLTAKQLVSHITRVHKVTIPEYKERFPGHEVRLFSPASIEKMRATKFVQGAGTAHRKKLEMRAKRAEEFDDDILCKVCGFSSKFSIISHITRHHGMTMDAYRGSYPGAIVQRLATEQREKVAQTLRTKLENEDERARFMEWRSYPSETKHWVNKGMSDDEARAKVSEWQSEAGLAQNNHPEMLERKSREMTGDLNYMSLRSLADKHGVTLEEATRLTPCYGRTGEKHPMFGKHHTEEALAKIAASEHLRYDDKRSKLERELEIKCREIGKLKTNERVATFNVDIVFSDKSLLIEFFGDFWHMNPSLYQSTAINKIKNKTAQEIWDRDARKLDKLRSLGFEVIVVWEQDWRFKKEEIMKGIKDAYDRAS